MLGFVSRGCWRDVAEEKEFAFGSCGLATIAEYLWGGTSPLSCSSTAP